MNHEHLSKRNFAAASLAGLIATLPMTATMLVVSRFLLRKRQPLHEPRTVADEFLKRTGLYDSETIDQHRDNIHLAAHFAYGASVGALYPAAERFIPLPENYRGPAFGLCVYAASYAGWLPTLEILPPPQRRPIGRNVLLIAAHLVWGASLAFTYRKLRRRSARRIAQWKPPANVSSERSQVSVTRHHPQSLS